MDDNSVFIDKAQDFHPYECGGQKKGCMHCVSLANKLEHSKNCALCEDGDYWGKDGKLKKA